MQKVPLLYQGRCHWMLVIVYEGQSVVWNVLSYDYVSSCYGDVDLKGQAEESWVESGREVEHTNRYYHGRN